MQGTPPLSLNSPDPIYTPNPLILFLLCSPISIHFCLNTVTSLFFYFVEKIFFNSSNRGHFFAFLSYNSLNIPLTSVITLFYSFFFLNILIYYTYLTPVPYTYPVYNLCHNNSNTSILGPFFAFFQPTGLQPFILLITSNQEK